MRWTTGIATGVLDGPIPYLDAKRNRSTIGDLTVVYGVRLYSSVVFSLQNTLFFNKKLLYSENLSITFPKNAFPSRYITYTSRLGTWYIWGKSYLGERRHRVKTVKSDIWHKMVRCVIETIPRGFVMSWKALAMEPHDHWKHFRSWGIPQETSFSFYLSDFISGLESDSVLVF